MSRWHQQSILAVLVIIVTIGIIIGFERDTPFFKQTPSPSPFEEIHYHAGFRIYKDGELHDFSGIEFMNLTPCAVEGEDSEKEDTHTDEKDFLHLHDNVGDVVHIHGPGRTWKHLFEYLKLTPSNDVTAYDGTTPVNDPLASPISAYQSMTFFIGSEPAQKDEILAEPITKSYIQEIEKKSETCATP